MNIQLTISLLVSDRLDSAGKCLRSLIPLLQELNSELIIVYTGKNPATRELAEQYTSHIIPFSWCSDFSKARNVGLKAAKGEWFLYLDDDEWFEDTLDIIEFFKSGECLHYQSALYIQRNYQDWEGQNYFDTSVGRMCRIMPDTTFIYPIHENLSPFRNPCKKLNVFVHHFGYVDQVEVRGMSEKSSRNIPLLLKRLDTEPDEIQCHMQLAKEYRNILQYDKAIEYCQKGLESAAKDKEIFSQELWMQVNLPLLVQNTGDIRRALEEGERMLQSSRTLEVSEAHLHSILAGFCLELAEHEKGLGHVNAYHGRMCYLKRHPDIASHQNGGTVTYESAKARAATTYINGLFFAAETDAPRQIKDILAWIPWENESEMARQYEALEKWKAAYPEQRNTILEGFSRIQSNNSYVILQKILYAEEFGNMEKASELFNHCISTGSEKIFWQYVEVAVRNKFSLKTLLKQTSIEAWDACSVSLSEHIPLAEIPEFYQKILPQLSEHPLFAELLNQHFLEKQMNRRDLDASRLADLLSAYCESIITGAKMQYRDEVLADINSHMLPSRCRFAFKIRRALQLTGSGKFAESIACLEDALHLSPEMFIAVSHLTRYLNEQIKNPPRPVSEEFTALGSQVKQVLSQLIEGKQWEEAYDVARRLVSILPDDLEALRLKQEILRAGSF